MTARKKVRNVRNKKNPRQFPFGKRSNRGWRKKNHFPCRVKCIINNIRVSDFNRSRSELQSSRKNSEAWELDGLCRRKKPEAGDCRERWYSKFDAKMKIELKTSLLLIFFRSLFFLVRKPSIDVYRTRCIRTCIVLQVQMNYITIVSRTDFFSHSHPPHHRWMPSPPSHQDVVVYCKCIC